MPELPFPHILGADAAGEVAELGEGVSGFEIGERVIPLLDRTLPLSEAAEAHRLVANNEVTGTVVLLPWTA